MPILPILPHRSSALTGLKQRIQSLTGLKIRQPDLYELAFTHPLVHGPKTLSFHRTNQRLEFLGDAVLDLVVAEFLFRKFPFKQEGFLTEMRSKVVNGEFLDQLGRKLGLDEILCDTSLRLYDGQVDSRNRQHLLKQLRSKGSVADAFEAFVGALYLDRGLNDTRKWLEHRILEQQIDWEELAQSGSNPKSRLLEWAQQNRAQYRMDCREIASGKGHAKSVLYRITLWVNGKEVAHAEGLSKRKAEQAVAAVFFEQRKQNDTL
jgi:ribonuclease-3